MEGFEPVGDLERQRLVQAASAGVQAVVQELLYWSHAYCLSMDV